MIGIKGVSKSFGTVKVLEGVDLEIPEGAFFCLLGPSGCGKTTLLRIVAGLETADAGSVSVGGRDVTGMEPHRRECAMVFQNYALWPHLTVAENITYGLTAAHRPKDEVRAALADGLKAYRLEGLDARLPHQLSGGQQQRVALARAMAMRPKALLMDEPLSNLDAALRKSLRRELLEFHRSSGRTVLYVTHDQEEALALSDRLALLMGGRVVESGDPRTLYGRPAKLETALFLGDMNCWREGKARAGVWSMGALSLPHPAGAGSILCIRPEHVKVRAASVSGVAADGPSTPGSPGTVYATITHMEFAGTHFTAALDSDAGPVLARVPLAEAEGLSPGLAARLDLPPEHCLWY